MLQSKSSVVEHLIKKRTEIVKELLPTFVDFNDLDSLLNKMEKEDFALSIPGPCRVRRQV